MNHSYSLGSLSPMASANGMHTPQGGQETVAEKRNPSFWRSGSDTCDHHATISLSLSLFHDNLFSIPLSSVCGVSQFLSLIGRNLVAGPELSLYMTGQIIQGTNGIMKQRKNTDLENQ